MCAAPGFWKGRCMCRVSCWKNCSTSPIPGDGLKRARGRRGLDILNTMQKELPLIVRSWDKALDKAFQDEEVDTRLVRLAKALDGMIVTNDFNLNKVACCRAFRC